MPKVPDQLLLECADFAAVYLREGLNENDWDKVETAAHALYTIARLYTVPSHKEK